MPGVYREKTCPTCGVKHRKKGEFCSKTCSNKGRDEEYRQKMRERMLYTDEGQLRSWNLNWNEDTDGPVVAGGSAGLERNQFVSDGDVWTKE